ncbi:MAG: hypothetical protein ABIG34_04430 [Candidatus Peregrinibacteria bacterium]
MCFKGFSSAMLWVFNRIKFLLREFFESIASITKEKFRKFVTSIRASYSDWLDSCSKSKTMLALQVLVFGLGFYVLILFLPDRIEQAFGYVTDPAPHISIGNLIAIVLSWLLDDYFPLSPRSALRLTLNKIICYLCIYLSILIGWGWKSAIRLSKNLIQLLPTFSYGQNL